MAGYVVDIEQKTLENENFREVLYTAPRLQLVVMTLQPGEEIVVAIDVAATTTATSADSNVRRTDRVISSPLGNDTRRPPKVAQPTQP